MRIRPLRITSEAHQVSLVVPDPEAGISRVLYLLDGNAALAELRPEWLERHPGTALVAIGYAITERFDLDRRSRDYTFPPPRDWNGGTRKALGLSHGGAEAFSGLLTQTIVPAVEESLGANNLARSLWGHSYGGLFALWLLARGGHGFSSIQAASPSLWWGDYVLEQQLLTGRFSAEGVRHVGLSMGDSEISRTGELLYSPDRLEKLAVALRRKARLTCDVTIFDTAGHGAAFARSLELAIISG